MLPLRLLSVWSGGQLAVMAGTLLKRRMLAGALRLESEEIRRQGAGQLLGQVLESQVVESLAISGGLVALASVVELALALLVLWAGAGGWLQVLPLLGMLGVTVWMAARYHRSRRAWTLERLAMTDDLVERMAGHRTRLVQEPRDRWHHGEDEALRRYLDRGTELDRRAIVLGTVLPSVWLVVGLVGLTDAFVAGAQPSGLAVALGGVLLAYGALRRLTMGLTHVSGAWISWEQVRAIFAAASRTDAGSPTVARARKGDGQGAAGGQALSLVEASGLSFRYPGRPEPVLRELGLRITPGQRLLLEGPSGGGKSTLGAMIAGLRVPDSGLLLVDGLDRRTLGLSGWRERVVAAPQFHENHVLTGTFSFNLLMGRGWPAGGEDLNEAEAICRELALGPLLDRMPAGLHQMVGETGWQLSHGERSRLFIARALLQRAELIVLDESFAALDPDTLRAAMGCVLKRARTLLVIAHP
jgi:ATP-binding cassette subfamily B protein